MITGQLITGYHCGDGDAVFSSSDHAVDIHVSVVVLTKRDHFSKYGPKRSNHAKFQLLKIKNKKVMAKKPRIVENTNAMSCFTAKRFEVKISPDAVIVLANPIVVWHFFNSESTIHTFHSVGPQSLDVKS